MEVVAAGSLTSNESGATGSEGLVMDSELVSMGPAGAAADDANERSVSKANGPRVLLGPCATTRLMVGVPLDSA